MRPLANSRARSPIHTAQGAWDQLQEAAIFHLSSDGTLGKAFETANGTVPFRGHRQRLDRYDEADFEAHSNVMRRIGLWRPGER